MRSATFLNDNKTRRLRTSHRSQAPDISVNNHTSMPAFQRGQLLVGLRHSYHLVEPAHRRTNNVWIASVENGESSLSVTLYATLNLLTCHSRSEKVVIKTAQEILLQNETKHLNILRGNNRIRQMIDSIESPPSIVLEYAEEDLRPLSIRRKLETVEIKTITRQLLEALAFTHAKNIIHTGRNASNNLNTFHHLLNRGQISNHRIFCSRGFRTTSNLPKHLHQSN